MTLFRRCSIELIESAKGPRSQKHELYIKTYQNVRHMLVACHHLVFSPAFHFSKEDERADDVPLQEIRPRADLKSGVRGIKAAAHRRRASVSAFCSRSRAISWSLGTTGEVISPGKDPATPPASSQRREPPNSLVPDPKK